MSVEEAAANILDEWFAQWGPVQTDPSLAIEATVQAAILRDLAKRLTDNYPFGHTVYAGQMLKPPHPLAAAAYSLAMRINPNNHALDGGPATAALEREVIRSLVEMVGYGPESHLGHLTSSGTIANLEALWIARELHPDRGIASSSAAHYTHSRMCGVLGMSHVAVETTPEGRMDIEHLRAVLADGKIGSVVATIGTTSLGAVDDLEAIEALCRAQSVRVHVDSAYGGFFRLLADDDSLAPDAAAAYRAMHRADSIVIDPHKHGLQPYGCGAVLFRDATVGRFYKHDSPYTYFTSDEMHLGEISLECSRAGAAAAAFWATLQAFPLTAGGLGQALRQTRSAAVTLAGLIGDSDHLALVTEPELDIVCFYPVGSDSLPVSAISAWTERVFADGMRATPDAYFLAKLTMTERELPTAMHPGLTWDQPTVTVLRSVLMKPEHAGFAPELYRRISDSVIRTQ